MRSSRLRGAGFVFLGLGLILLGLVLVVPFLKLWGKETIELEPESQLAQAEERGAVLPIFPGLSQATEAEETEYFLTIEKLGIERAPIRTNLFVDNRQPYYLASLTSAVGHLRGTPRPGQKGNSLLFGHSALPYLYSPRNFQTIFTKIDELEYGDTILVERGQSRFRFKVERGGLMENDVSLGDFFSRKSRLTLITCYPPGFKARRYLVTAILTE